MSPLSAQTLASRPLLIGILIVLSALSWSTARYAEAAVMPADPSALTAAPAGFTVAILEVSVNRQPQDEPIMALRDERGNVFVGVSDLAKWRMKIPQSPAAPAIEYSGDRFFPLSAFVGLESNINEGTQALTLSGPPELFTSTAIDALTPTGPIPQRTATGGFVNYTLLATHVDTTTTSGSFEVGAFGRFGTANMTGVAINSPDLGTTFTRLDTVWTYAMPERLSTIRAGDAISRAGAWGNSVRFGGVQYATDFATQPNLVLTPGQFATGSATVPSTVDVFINNALVTSQQVRPGPFSITNIPPVTGSGNVTLIVRDELGREQIITRPFYASQSLLREGLTDFSFDAGALRHNYGVESADYGQWVAAGTYRRGLTNSITGEVRAEALKGLGNAGVGLSMLVADFGIASATVAGGHNPEGNGGRVSIGFERQGRGLSFFFGGSWRSSNFRLAGEEGALSVVKREVLASADYALGRYGSVSLTYVSRAFLNDPTTTIASLGYTVGLDRLGYLAMSVSKIKSADDSTIASLLWTMPLGNMTTASVGVDRLRTTDGTGDRDGRVFTLQRNLPVGDGYGYRLRLDNQGERRGQFDYQNRVGTYSAELAQSDGQTGGRITASGGLGVISGNVFLSRLINDSFGLVRVAGYPDVRVYSENRVIGRTNANGELIVPRLLPYMRNSLRIDQADLPLDAEFNLLAQDAVPFARSGIVVDFDVKPSRGALVTIVQADGTAVPAGARVRVEGQGPEKAAPVALDGVAYLTGLEMRNRVAVSWQGNACTFEFDYPVTTDPQPAIGPIVCR